MPAQSNGRVWTFQRDASDVWVRADVVTHEKPEKNRSIVKIPNPCVALGVKYITRNQMLRQGRARFVLGAQQ